MQEMPPLAEMKRKQMQLETITHVMGILKDLKDFLVLHTTFRWTCSVIYARLKLERHKLHGEVFQFHQLPVSFHCRLLCLQQSHMLNNQKYYDPYYTKPICRLQYQANRNPLVSNKFENLSLIGVKTLASVGFESP